MLSRNHPDRIHVAFNDHRLVANAGLLLPATLVSRAGTYWTIRAEQKCTIWVVEVWQKCPR